MMLIFISFVAPAWNISLTSNNVRSLYIKLLFYYVRSLSYRCSVSVWTLFGLLRALMTLMATDEAKWLYWIIRMKSDRHRKLIYRELPQKDSFLIESLKYKKYRLSAHGQHHLFWCWKVFPFLDDGVMFVCTSNSFTECILCLMYSTFAFYRDFSTAEGNKKSKNTIKWNKIKMEGKNWNASRKNRGQ
jgi:hypothetical protein